MFQVIYIYAYVTHRGMFSSLSISSFSCPTSPSSFVCWIFSKICSRTDSQKKTVRTVSQRRRRILVHNSTPAPRWRQKECRRCVRPMKARLQSTCFHRSRVQQWSSCRRCWSLGQQSAPKRRHEECRRCVRPMKAHLHTTNCFQHRSNSVALPLLLQHDQQIGHCRRRFDTGGIPMGPQLSRRVGQLSESSEFARPLILLLE